ncbi:flippase [Patescibacteria group bacterium]
MSTARKILSNTAFQIAGRAGTALLSLVVIKIITSYLDVGKYGEYTNVYEFLALFAIIADFGLYTIAVREMSKDENRIPKILGNILTIRVTIGFLVLIGVITGGFLVPSHQGTQIPWAIMIATTATFVALSNGTITSVLQEKYKMQYQAKGVIFGKIMQVSYMALVAFVLFKHDTFQGFYHLFWAGAIGNTAMLLYTIHIVKRYTPIRLRFDKDYMKYILKQAMPYGLALFLSNIYFRADAILLFNMRGREEAGLYGVAARMLEALVLLPIYFMNAVLPTLTKHIKEKTETYKKIIQLTFDFQLMLSIPLLIGGIILAMPLINVISTPDFVSNAAEGFFGSDAALQIVLFSFVLISVNVIFNFTLIAIGKQAHLIWINGSCAIFNVVANILIIPWLGFRGAALTTVASEILVFILVFVTVKKFLPFKIHLGRTSKTVLSALIMGAVVYLLRDPAHDLVGNYNVLLLVPVGAAVYAASLFGTKAVTKDLLVMLKK